MAPADLGTQVVHLDDHSLEETDKRDGKVIATAHLTVSGDGKTMGVAWKDMLHGTSGSFTYLKQ